MKVVISLEVSSWDELKALVPAIEPLFQKGAKVEVEKPSEKEKPVVKPLPAEKTKPLPQQEQVEQETAEAEDDCFGTYEASDPACQQCGVAKKCKAETLKKKSQPRETETEEETSVEVEAEAEAGTGASGEIPDISSAPTLKEAVKTLMKAGIDDEEEIIDIITKQKQKDELEFELPANWKEKVKRLLILLK